MVLPRITYRVFMVLGLLFKSLIHLELIFVYSETYSFTCGLPVFQVLPMFLHALLKISWPHVFSFISEFSMMFLWSICLLLYSLVV